MPNNDSLSTESFAAMCKALGHPVRIWILEHLRKVNLCTCGKIVKIFPLAQSTVSQHLKTLTQAGLVKGEIKAPAKCYGVDEVMLEKFKKTVAAL